MQSLTVAQAEQPLLPKPAAGDDSCSKAELLLLPVLLALAAAAPTAAVGVNTAAAAAALSLEASLFERRALALEGAFCLCLSISFKNCSIPLFRRLRMAVLP